MKVQGESPAGRSDHGKFYKATLDYSGTSYRNFMATLPILDVFIYTSIIVAFHSPCTKPELAEEEETSSVIV